jgi:hypothetical protein
MAEKGTFPFTGTENQNLALSKNRIVLDLTLIYTAARGAYPFTGTESQNLSLCQNRIVLDLTLIYTAEKGHFYSLALKLRTLLLVRTELPKTTVNCNVSDPLLFILY